MFTWNFQYMSKVRLAETLKQLNLNVKQNSVLIRIHTAIHLEDEAVDLAKFIKSIVPQASILGTSTSAVIYRGKCLSNQCVISVTQMNGGTVRSKMYSLFDETDGKQISAQSVAECIRESIIFEDTKLLLTFFTPSYRDVSTFVVASNGVFPGVQMIGGVTDHPTVNTNKEGFVFDETGWSDKAAILASFSGEELESFTACATGVQTIGEECEITDIRKSVILSIDDKNPEETFWTGTIAGLTEIESLAELFPFAYSEAEEIPVYLRIERNRSPLEMEKDNLSEDQDEDAIQSESDTDMRRDLLYTNCFLKQGLRIKKGFIHDRKIVADNRDMFRRIESFEKAETIFGYADNVRTRIYGNCLRWELSTYEKSNICGCVTNGEIASHGDKNTFSNCSFVLTVAGEKPFPQEYNPYAFSHTDLLTSDHQDLLNYLLEMEKKLDHCDYRNGLDEIKGFVRECESLLLYSESEEIPNAAAMNMDIKVRGYDRVCMINVMETAEMEKVFPTHLIDLTYKNYISKCSSFVRAKKYHMYILDKWHIAIAEPSYRVALSKFVKDMENLQRELFEYSDELIAIVPIFCVIDGCVAETLDSTYYSARVEMINKNMQFYVCEASSMEHLDENSIRERYHMVNVINYAIANDGVVPYFQGIHDNKQFCIHHYEALMRLRDENGKIYYPNSFLDVARNYGLLYDEISKIMIRKVFERFRDKEGLSVSMNLGIRDIKNKEITELIYDELAKSPHPDNYIFEILENEDVADYNELVAFVDRVHEMGGLISIDDFGSGFSNLQHLLSIHSDFLKIDGSIVVNCCNSKESENVIALITGWKKLSANRIGIIAEFVENDGIQKKLMMYDVDYSQGYLFSKPSPHLEGEQKE